MLKIALIYDFDKTLSESDMQNYDFIKNLGISIDDFWKETGKITKEHNADKILAYMYMMVKTCKEKGIPLTKDYLKECGKNIILHKGVDTWFKRINTIGMSLGVEIEHYIVSSGITDIILGTPIYKYFKETYGCSFIYDKNGEAVWPKMAVNYTQKTQFIVRIAKGAFDVTDDDLVNKKTTSFNIPYNNMIYIGDGITDIPCMNMVKSKGGYSIALYSEGNKKKVLPLVEDKRVNFACLNDFSEDSKLYDSVKLMITNMVLRYNLETKEQEQLLSVLKEEN
ncbi:MAG: haloacid dehalogenase-like hydrolase [Acholeplasmatales bacterium]|nr:haloacid dehalogenase-like hydrolase [Acholeplasmatales bacterium]